MDFEIDGDETYMVGSTHTDLELDGGHRSARVLGSHKRL
jgi:hypothetical protein